MAAYGESNSFCFHLWLSRNGEGKGEKEQIAFLGELDCISDTYSLLLTYALTVSGSYAFAFQSGAHNIS